MPSRRRHLAKAAQLNTASGVIARRPATIPMRSAARYRPVMGSPDA
ncbi:Uncharacterised protein [Mycobacteroides abscessus subsp. abscessus]|nr:Uncharacterised protein [Mycobacteroides abscessus subsp. abscessus]